MAKRCAMMAGTWRGGGIMRFHPRLPNDTATRLLLVVLIVAILAMSGSLHDPAADNAVAISAIAPAPRPTGRSHLGL